VPTPCAGLGAALPAVLQRSVEEAALLVRHLPPADQAHRCALPGPYAAEPARAAAHRTRVASAGAERDALNRATGLLWVFALLLCFCSLACLAVSARAAVFDCL
jgi:hypothetical protein